MKIVTKAALVATMTLLPLTAMAQDHHGHHAASPEDAYAPAMHEMHEAMGAVKATGNADVDFVQGMIPHHQGAIDMAKIQLEKGKDPEIRKLSEEIIKAQEDEIAMMKAWLKKHKK